MQQPLVEPFEKRAREIYEAQEYGKDPPAQT